MVITGEPVYSHLLAPEIHPVEHVEFNLVRGSQGIRTIEYDTTPGSFMHPTSKPFSKTGLHFCVWYRDEVLSEPVEESRRFDSSMRHNIHAQVPVVLRYRHSLPHTLHHACIQSGFDISTCRLL